MGADWYSAALFLGVVVISDARSFLELEEKTKAIIKALKKIPDAPKVIDFMKEVHSRMEGSSTDENYSMVTIGIGYVLYNPTINEITEKTMRVRAFVDSVDNAHLTFLKDGESIKDVKLVPCIPSACYLVERIEDELYYEKGVKDEEDEEEDK